MNPIALYPAVFILICSIISFVAGYYSIPSFHRKSWFQETTMFFGNIFIILVLSGIGYYMINNQNLSPFMTVTICVTLGLIILPVLTQINWSY